MKRTISSTRKKRRKGRKKQKPEVTMESVKILRTVGDQEAFYFYEAFGKPTGETARNLSDFLDIVKSVKTESLRFHLQRRDFQNWIERILDDSELVSKLGKITSSNSNDIRLSIQNTVENRIKELRG
jgi:hypothetical protein